MKQFDITTLAGKSIFLRADFAAYIIGKKVLDYHVFQELCDTIEQLSAVGCTIRLLIARGDPFVQNVPVSDIVDALSQRLSTPITLLAPGDKQQTALACLPNAFSMPTDKHCDLGLVQWWSSDMDAIVLQNHHYLDARYASSQGLMNTGLPVWMSPALTRIHRWMQGISNRKIGLIIGGEQVAWQMELAEALVNQLSFVALGHAITAACVADDSFDPMFDQSVVGYLRRLSTQGVNVLYPIEVLAYHEGLCRTRVCLLRDLDPQERVKDVCLGTINRIYEEINSDIDTVIFSGTLGQYQDPRFHKGTTLLLQYLSKHRVETVLLGQDILQAASSNHLLKNFDYLIEGSSYERELMVKRELECL